MSSFLIGFIKRAADLGISSEDISGLTDLLFNKDRDLFDVTKNSKSTPAELLSIVGNIGKSALPGAIVGGAAGYLTSNQKDRTKRILTGAGIGGGLSGLYGAYNLGDNTRDKFKVLLENLLNDNSVARQENNSSFFKSPDDTFKETDELLRKKLNIVNSLPWPAYYVPPYVREKLK